MGLTAAKAQYRFDQWTANDGLPQNSVRKIVQTEDGYIWFTTLDGLVRFDGVRFTVFNRSNSKNFPSNRLFSLFVENGKTLWIITEERTLASYSGGEFRSFTAADGLPPDLVEEVMQDFDGSILAFSIGGVARFDGHRFSIIKGGENFDVQASRPYYAPSGTLWELDRNLLSATKNGVTAEYELPASLKTLLADEKYRLLQDVKMLEVGDGELWLTAKGKICKLQNGTLGEVVAEGMTRSEVAALQNEVTVIKQDKLGDVWFGTMQSGACRFSQNRFTCFDSKNGIADDYVYDIFLDREGTLWFGTNERGIYRVTEQSVTSITTENGLAINKIYPVLETRDGAVWIGGYGGLSKYDHGKITNYLKPPDGSDIFSVHALFEDNARRLWIGRWSGVSYVENGKLYDAKKTLGLDLGEVDRVYDIQEDKNGVFWFATDIGLYKYDGVTVKRLTTDDGLPGNDVKAILEARNGETLWIGTYAGIAKIENGEITAFTEQDGLAGNRVRSLYEDETGTLWIGTYESGLSRFKNGKFTVFRKENGLFSDGVFQILEDARRNFWMSSNQGIYRVTRAQLEDFADGKIASIVSTAFNKSDGMPNTEANGGAQPAGTKLRDGQLWFPTQDGVAIIHPESIELNPLPPPVVIETLRIDNEKTAAFPNGIRMMPGQENLEIDYTGLSFIRPEQVHFRYRLENLEENWTEAGTRRTAFYPHLAPGEYTFRVIAANSDNVWNETGATLKITVIPPFYRTWVFLLATAALGLFVIYVIYRRRVLQLENARRLQEEFSRRLINANESERRRIAGELHDSIGQSLAMIKNRALLSAESAGDENMRKQLELITAQATQTIGEVREISYALRPYLLDNLGLTKAVKSLLNNIAETSELMIETELDDVDHIFDSEAEMSIYRIIQESLSNILKHAEASEVQVFLKKSERNLTVLISDDGKGFDIHAVEIREAGKGGFGLLGISERVKLLGGTREIESEAGGGTTILIKIPVPTATTHAN